MAEVVFKLDNLSIAFGRGNDRRSVVKNVSFELRQGHTLAIVGESGSGKTVTSLSIMQLMQMNKVIFDSGEMIFSSDIAPTGREERITPNDPFLTALRGKRVAMIFQEPMTALNPVLTCGEQLAEMLRLHRGLKGTALQNEMLRLFNEVKLPRPEQMLGQYPHQLSGGQRQRVMIAMAISCNPAILIADEPTTALDVTVQKTILQLLKELQLKYGMAIIFITHDLGVVAEIADEVVVMQHGVVVEQGSAQEILNHPRYPYTKGLLACRPVPGVKMERLQTMSDFLTTDSAKLSETKHDHRVSESEILLSVSLVSKVYKQSGGLFKAAGSEVRAVDTVSFEIKRGETLGLVGESGCGKTTLSRMILGLIPATQGEIVFDLGNKKISLKSASKSELRAMRKDVQIIFQDPYSALDPRQSIAGALTEPMEVHGLYSGRNERRQKAAELLLQVGLPEDALTRYPHEFSGGQRQRIVIARALAVQPKFIICDESVSALDVSVQAQVLNLLNDLKHQYGLTYLFISHDLGVVYHMSDRIMVMNKGKIEELDTAEQVFHHPKSSYTSSLIACIPGFKKD